MGEPTTEAGRADHDIAWQKDGSARAISGDHDWERKNCLACGKLALLEAEARAPLREALAELYDEAVLVAVPTAHLPQALDRAERLLADTAEAER